MGGFHPEVLAVDRTPCASSSSKVMLPVPKISPQVKAWTSGFASAFPQETVPKAKAATNKGLTL